MHIRPITPTRSTAASARPAGILPGLLLTLAVTAAAWAAQTAEARLAGQAYVEALVLAILIGAAVRALLRPGPRHDRGIRFCAHTLLEVAVMLLGASVSAQALAGAGPGLLGGIALVVACAIGAGYGLGRLLGLAHRPAVLIACGNAICGNSAIAAVAPVIDADARDVSSAIAFTAILGVAVVLALPAAGALLGFGARPYGVLAGLTVYAVPQVLAATAPAGALAMQVGAVVKLARVLMLGPVVLGLSLLARGSGAARPPLHRLVPWFIAGFLALAALRLGGWLPPVVLAPAAAASSVLTIVAMAALGLQTDIAALAGAGLRASLAVMLSLAVLATLSLGLIRAFGLA